MTLFDVSVRNCSLYEGCKITCYKHTRNLAHSDRQETVDIVKRNAVRLFTGMREKGETSILLTGAMTIRIYLAIAHAADQIFDRVFCVGLSGTPTEINRPVDDY